MTTNILSKDRDGVLYVENPIVKGIWKAVLIPTGSALDKIIKEADEESCGEINEGYAFFEDNHSKSFLVNANYKSDAIKMIARATSVKWIKKGNFRVKESKWLLICEDGYKDVRRRMRTENTRVIEFD